MMIAAEKRVPIRRLSAIVLLLVLFGLAHAQPLNVFGAFATATEEL